MGDGGGDRPANDRIATDEFAIAQPVPPDAEWELVVQRPVDPSEYGGLTSTIVSAVADAEGVRLTDVEDPPLYEVLDTAALEAAFFSSGDPRYLYDADVSTEFMYRDYRIVVRSDGWVLVYERRDG